MQEISNNIFIDHNSLGLVTGIIRTQEGAILIDSPSRQDELKSWRAATAKLIMGDARFLVILDNHFDRMLSIKGCDCVVVGHVNVIAPIKSKQTSAKNPEDPSVYAEGHDPNSAGNRMLPPEITFADNLSIHLGEVDMLLEHHPGSNYAGIWAALPKHKVIFVGDTVISNQPPFMAYSNPSVWIEELKLLGSRKYKGYQIVSSRNGIVTQEQVHNMGRIMAGFETILNNLAEKQASLEEYYAVIPKMLRKFEASALDEEIFYNRLRWGLTTYYEQINR